MMNSTTWPQALKRAPHYIALGMTDVYLDGDFESLDWSKCIRMTTGGSHRLDIATDVVFEFEDKGIKGRWHFDIEPHSANGSGHYQINVEGIQRILGMLTGAPRQQFKAYLEAAAAAVEKKADEYQAIAAKEYGMAGMLRSAAKDS